MEDYSRNYMTWMMNQPTEEKAQRFYFLDGEFDGSTFMISPSYSFCYHIEASIHLLLDEKNKLWILPYDNSRSYTFIFILCPSGKYTVQGIYKEVRQRMGV